MGKAKDNKLNRRKMMLVAGGAVAGASALIAAPYRTKIKRVARRVMVNTGVGRGLLSLGNASYDEWLNEVGATFSLGGGTNMRLVGVRALPTYGARPDGVRTQGFAAFFDPTCGGVSISTRDQARIGQLMLDGGVHEGQQLVPREWVERMHAPSAIAP